MKQEALDKLQAFIDKQKKFKIEGYNGSLPLRQFIMSFHHGTLQNTPNIYCDTNTKMFVKHDAMRSLIDTIIACQSHYDVSLQEILGLFQDAYVKKELRGHFCGNINRLVLRLYDPHWSLYEPNEHLIDKNLPGVYFSDFFTR